MWFRRGGGGEQELTLGHEMRRFPRTDSGDCQDLRICSVQPGGNRRRLGPDSRQERWS